MHPLPPHQTPPHEPYIASASFRAIFDVCLELAHIPDSAKNPFVEFFEFRKSKEKYIPASAVFKLLHKAQAVTQDPAIGLKIGQKIHPKAYFHPDIGNAIVWGNSLRQSLFLVRRYQALTQTFNQISLKSFGRYNGFGMEACL